MSGNNELFAELTKDPAAKAGSTSLWCLGGRHRRCRDVECACNVCKHGRTGARREKRPEARKERPKVGRTQADAAWNEKRRQERREQGLRHGGRQAKPVTPEERAGILAAMEAGVSHRGMLAQGFRERAVRAVKKELRDGGVGVPKVQGAAGG